jgi:hypothetical protein
LRDEARKVTGYLTPQALGGCFKDFLPSLLLLSLPPVLPSFLFTMDVIGDN